MSTLQDLFRSLRSQSGVGGLHPDRRSLRTRMTRGSVVFICLFGIALALPSAAFAGNPTKIIWYSFPTSESYGNPDFAIEAMTDAAPRTSDPGSDRTWVYFSATGDCEVAAGSYHQYPASGISTASIHITAAGSCAIFAYAYNDAGVISATDSEYLAIGKGTQSIVFPSQGLTLSVNTGAQLSAYSVSLMQSGYPTTGLPLQFESLDPGVCSVNDAWPSGYVFGISGGTCTVIATQGGNSNWSYTSSRETIKVVPASQTIVFPPISNKMPGDQFSLSGDVAASSGMQVALTSSPGCDVSVFQVHVGPNVGSCTITAHQGGNSQYDPAKDVSQSFYIGNVRQKIADLVTNEVGADNCGKDGHGYESSCPNDTEWCPYFAEWAWQTAGVITPPGELWQDSVYAHDAHVFYDYGVRHNTYSPVPHVGDAVVYVKVGTNASTMNAGKIQHVAVVTWVSPDKTTFTSVGGNEAGKNSSLFLVRPNGTISSTLWKPGVTGQLAADGTPTVVAGFISPVGVDDTSLADSTYSMKTGDTMTTTFAVASPAGIVSNVDALVGPVLSDVDLKLYRPNGALVSPTDPGITFTKTANTVEITIAGADPGLWNCVIDAIQLEGTENVHLSVDSTPIDTTVIDQDSDQSQYHQPVSFTATVVPPTAGVPAPTGSAQFNLDGSPSGATVVLDAAGQAIWTTSSLAVGSHTVSFNYLGSSPLVAPSSSTITHVVTKADQTVTFGALAAKTYGDADFTIDATASSGLTVSFAAAGNCTVGGSTVHIVGAGSCTITASQVGDGNYNAAADVVQSFDIAKANQSITFGALGGKTYGDPDFTISASASSGLAVTFAAAGDCTDSGTTVHVTAAGSCTITASQAGDANYNPASDVAQSFSIAKKPMTITARAATKLYGQTLTFAGTEFTLAGLVPGDSVTSVTLLSAGQSVGAQPGSYEIVPSAALGNRLSNYVLSYVNGTLTVNLVATVGLDGVTISGGSTIDSYNGANGPYSSNTKLSAAFVVSNGSISMDGSPAIRGDVRSTRGRISLTGGSLVTGNAYAGTTIATRSLVRGSASPNSPLAALTAPAVAACSPYSSSAGLSGSYTYNAKTGNLSVSGANTLTIASGTYCFGSITLSGSAKLVVSGPVILSLTGQFTADGATVTNLTNKAANLQISTSYAGNNGVVLAGSGSACLSVYAPTAQVVLSGGTQLSGLVLGKSITLAGSAAIHQDTSLGGVWASHYQN